MGPKEGAANAGDKASPLFGVTIPTGYRQWELIAPSQETGRLDELRGMLGNDIALKAYCEGTLPFPDGAKLAKLAWKHAPSVEFEGAFVPSGATMVQIMVKDAKKYAATDGWGFGASSTASRSTRRSTGRVSHATRPT